ncbi:MAG TPA: response regulator [Candidatus Methylomirabilis sp.]|jgi:CheY-like chemotaxis protein
MPAGLALEGQTTLQYCHACGEEVLTYTVPAAAGVEIRCSYCGIPLGHQAPQDEARMQCVLLADDEKFIRWVVRDLLVEQHLAETVVACEGGIELLTKLTERMRAKERTQLVILDILMRDLDGVATAKAIRAVERGFEVKWPAPILFLSALRPDTALRNFVARLQPALFLNKAVDATPDRLGIRLRKMMEYFSRVRNGASSHLSPA